jgi:alanine dehydrogenase
MPYVLKVAECGAEAAIAKDPVLAMGVNTFKGEIRHLQRWIAPEEGE